MVSVIESSGQIPTNSQDGQKICKNPKCLAPLPKEIKIKDKELKDSIQNFKIVSNPYVYCYNCWKIHVGIKVEHSTNQLKICATNGCDKTVSASIHKHCRDCANMYNTRQSFSHLNLEQKKKIMIELHNSLNLEESIDVIKNTKHDNGNLIALMKA